MRTRWVALLCAFLLAATAAPALGQEIIFEDDFESSGRPWVPFEHIIDDGTCYDEDLGDIEILDGVTGPSGATDNRVISVNANSAGQAASNHMLALHPVDPQPISGGTVSVEAWVQVPPGAIADGQTGPEFGVQSHFVNPASGFLTDEAAVQYVVAHDGDLAGDPIQTWTFDSSAEGWTESGTNAGSTLSHSSDAQNNIGNLDGTSANVTVHPNLNGGEGVASPGGGGFVGEFDESTTISGDDFWVMFQNNYDDYQEEFIYVSGDTGTEVWVDGVSAGTIPADGVLGIEQTISIHTANQVVTGASRHVTTSAEVTVFGYGNRDFSDDAFTVYPTASLGYNYTAVGATNSIAGDAYVSQISVLATTDGTSVDIGATTVSLDRGEAYTYTSDADLTGTKIHSDAPVAVWSGRRCQVNPASVAAIEAGPGPSSGGTCEAGLFQVVNGHLKILDPATGNYDDIGTPLPKYNAAGYRTADGYAYAMATTTASGITKSDVLRIDTSDGTYTIVGNPDLGSRFVGDIDNTTDTYYVAAGGTDWYIVDMTDGTATAFPITSGDGSAYTGGADMTILNSTAYLMKGNTLTVVDLATQTFTSTTVAEAPTSNGTFGAAWITEGRTMYFGRNSNGNGAGEIWRLDNYDTGAPMATRVSTVGATNSNDGFGCPDQANPLPGVGVCDMVTQQLVPDESLATDYLLPALGINQKYRVVAAFANTEVRVDGVLQATLAEGEHYEATGGDVHVTTTRPVVAYLMVGGVDVWEDIAFVTMPGYRNAVKSATFSSVANPLNPFSHAASVILPTSEVVNLRIDGAAPTGTTETAIGTSGFTDVRFPVAAGTHTITSTTNADLLIVATGEATSEAYAYVAGMSFPDGSDSAEFDTNGAIMSPTGLGDFSAAMGGDLEFSYWNWAGDSDDGFSVDDYQTSIRLAMTGANGTELVTSKLISRTTLASGSWISVSVALDRAGGWRHTNGALASSGDIQGVLANLDTVEIGTESIVGFDTGSPTTQSDADAERWAVDDVTITSGGARWQVWGDIGQGDIGWIPIPEMDHQLDPDVWYEVEVIANFDTDVYQSLRVTGNGYDKTVDLSDIIMQTDVKSTVHGIGTWVTLESENLWTECTATHSSNTLYDDIALQYVSAPPPAEEPTDSETVAPVFTDEVSWVIVTGITSGCDADGNYCAKDPVTRGQMATFLARAIGLTGTPSITFADTVGHTHEWNIRRVAAAGISLGCGDGTNFCPDQEITRAQMATFLSRAFELALDPDYSHTFDDVANSNVHAAAITALAQYGISEGCTGDGLEYCPDASVTREQMAAFLYRAIEVSNELFGTESPVTLYADAGWVGVSFPAGVGVHTQADLVAASMNDRATSIRVADGYQANVCWSDGGTGTCAAITYSIANLTSLNLSDRISWIEVIELP